MAIYVFVINSLKYATTILEPNIYLVQLNVWTVEKCVCYNGS